jgi:FMN phosphatase YigB (HAD superfamily)
LILYTRKYPSKPVAIMNKKMIAFDLYGTLLSTGSIFRELAKLYGESQGQTIAMQARRYQLEYTWRSNSMGRKQRVVEAVCKFLTVAQEDTNPLTSSLATRSVRPAQKLA